MSDIPILEHKESIESYYRQLTNQEQTSVFAVLLKIFEKDKDLRGLYRWNEFSYDVEHTGGVAWSYNIKENCEVTDNDITEVMAFLAKKFNFSPPRSRVEDTIKTMSLRKSYHPIKDYLDNLQWDGCYRINNFLHDICGVEKSDYSTAVSRKMIVAAVARIYKPGIKFDYMTILEGKQGVRKTTLLEILAGKDYHSTVNFSMSNKDIVDIMRGKWILEIKEMQGFKKVETDKVKALLDQHTDRVRLSFGHRAQDFKRNSIFVGTMNPLGENKYLSDETGNRRFWPILCIGKINIELAVNIRDQVWAEALYLFKKGEPIYMETTALEELANQEQEERLAVDPWIDIIKEYLSDKVGIPNIEISMQRIYDECLKIPFKDVNKGVAGRIGRAIKSTGWIRKNYTTRKEREDKGTFYIPVTELTQKVMWDETEQQ